MKERVFLLLPLLALMFLLLFESGPLAAEEMFEEVSTEDMLYVRGLVSKVDLAQMQISVRPAKGIPFSIIIFGSMWRVYFAGTEKLDSAHAKSSL